MIEKDSNFLRVMKTVLGDTIFYIVDIKERPVDDGTPGGYEKIHLKMENMSYSLQEFKDYVKFIFNDNEDVEKFRYFEDIIEYVQDKHPDFLNKDNDYYISEFIKTIEVVKELGIFLSAKEAEKCIEINRSSLHSPKVVEMPIKNKNVLRLFEIIKKTEWV